MTGGTAEIAEQSATGEGTTMTGSTPITEGGARPASRTNVLAVVALAVAVFLPLAGVICGHLALAQIREGGEEGEDIARAGLVLSYVLLGVGLVVFLVFTGIALSLIGLAVAVG